MTLREELHALFEQTLYYLYRVLFVLFAEAQEVLPISGPTPYRTTYSVDHLIELARSGSAAPGGPTTARRSERYSSCSGKDRQRTLALSASIQSVGNSSIPPALRPWTLP